MKNAFRLRWGEAGQALVAVLVVLLMSMVLVPPMLGMSSSGMRSTQIREEDTLALYAADAGVEDALFRLTRNLQGNATPLSYAMATEFNNCDVDVTIDDLGDTTYRITSTSDGLGGLPTTVESYVQFSDFSFLTDYALVTNGALSTQPGTRVEGDTRYIYPGPLPDPNIKGDIDGEVTLERIDGAKYLDKQRVHRSCLRKSSADCTFKASTVRLAAGWKGREHCGTAQRGMDPYPCTCRGDPGCV